MENTVIKWTSLLLLIFIGNIECKEYKADVLIVGAGMTGISAAHHLSTKHNQDNFIIIEGDNRIGGRMKHVEFGGKIIEEGANWIHGTVGNPIFNLAKKYGLKMNIGFDYDDIIVRARNGTDVSDKADEYFEMIEAAIEEAEKIRKRKRQNKEPDVSYRSALSMAGWLPDNELMDLVEYSMFDFEWAVPPDEISLKNTGFEQNYKFFKKEDAFILDQRGFAYIVERMADEILKKNDKRLQLGKAVKKIVYNDKGVTITTENGDIFRGKYVILTVSVGVLEHNVIEFVPKLPYWKRDVVNNFEMSYYLKIFIKFPSETKRFWDPETFVYYSHPRRGYHSLIHNLEGKDSFEAGTNLLMITVTGQEAVRASRISKKELIAEFDEIFQNLYGSEAIPVEDVLVPAWINDPLYFGMYSSWPLGVTGETFDILQLPVGRIFFAGEYTSKRYYGFVHGAYYEGRRVAKTITKCKKRGNCAATFHDPEKAPLYYKEKKK